MTASVPTKLPPRIVPSDDFEIMVDGVSYHPHAGEHVQFAPTVPVGALRVAAGVQRLAVQLDALRNEEGQFIGAALAQMTDLMEGHFDELAAFVAPLIRGWTWTDDNGEPLAQPDGTPASLAGRSQEEIYYLWQAAQQRNPAARKNA